MVPIMGAQLTREAMAGQFRSPALLAIMLAPTPESSSSMSLPTSKRASFVRRLALALALGAVTSRPALAQAGWVPRLQLDNDVYNYWQRHTRRPDEQYTNGVRASLESNGAPWWGRRFASGIRDCAGATGPGPCRATTITLGQDLYTPNLDRAPHKVPDWERERPYFAWLYLTGEARVSSQRTLREVSVSLGVTGPPAGGELAQHIAHRIGFNDEATGWETQVGFEPGIIAEYRQSARLARIGGADGLAADLVPQAALAVGNVLTRAQAGGTVRVGWNLSHPWHPAAWRGRARTEWWASAGARTMYVARNMSLDGTWRDPQRHVERVPRVHELEFAGGVRVRSLTIGYRAVTRSREYRTGPASHTFSSMIFGYRAAGGG